MERKPLISKFFIYFFISSSVEQNELEVLYLDQIQYEKEIKGMGDFILNE